MTHWCWLVWPSSCDCRRYHAVPIRLLPRITV